MSEEMGPVTPCSTKVKVAQVQIEMRNMCSIDGQLHHGFKARCDLTLQLWFG